jgi:sugar phosphate isomerase/epimerase
MKLGYNTSGFPHHRLEDAITILAELGYQSVAITLDHHALNPFDPSLDRQLHDVRRLLEMHRLCSVIETGARFLLDPRRKHQPTLVDPRPEARERRLDYLCRAVDIARELGSDAVSFWSGKATTAEPHALLFARLVEGCQRLAEYADKQNVRLAFEPEPDMFIDALAKFAPLHAAVAHPRFGLTIDIGHLHCLREDPIPDRLSEWKEWLWNIHIEDMRRDVHEHLMFSEGEIDFPPILQRLAEIGYAGGLHVELNRHGRDAVEAARRAREHLKGWLALTSGP